MNARDTDGWSPLMYAARFNSDPEVCEVLIKAGANPKLVLWHATGFKSHPEVCEALIKAGADVNAKNSRGESPLIHAVKCGRSPEVCAVLIKAGADVNARDNDGKKAIDYAKENNALKDTDVYGQLHDASFKE